MDGISTSQLARDRFRRERDFRFFTPSRDRPESRDMRQEKSRGLPCEVQKHSRTRKAAVHQRTSPRLTDVATPVIPPSNMRHPHVNYIPKGDFLRMYELNAGIDILTDIFLPERAPFSGYLASRAPFSGFLASQSSPILTLRYTCFSGLIELPLETWNYVLFYPPFFSHVFVCFPFFHSSANTQLGASMPTIYSFSPAKRSKSGGGADFGW